MARNLKILYGAILTSLIILSLAFSHTRGLVYGADRQGRLLFTEELQSSGSNDNLMIECGAALFAFPFILLLSTWRRKLVRASYAVLISVWIAQGTLLFGIDAGSILKTIFESRNLVMLLWMIGYLTVVPVFSGWAYTAANKAPVPEVADRDN